MQPFIFVYLDPEASEFSSGLNLHVLERLGVHIRTMRIKARQHAVDCVFDQFFIINWIDIFRTRPLQHISENFQQLVHIGATAVLRKCGTQRPLISTADRKA